MAKHDIDRKEARSRIRKSARTERKLQGWLNNHKTISVELAKVAAAETAVFATAYMHVAVKAAATAKRLARKIRAAEIKVEAQAKAAERKAEKATEQAAACELRRQQQQAMRAIKIEQAIYNNAWITYAQSIRLGLKGTDPDAQMVQQLLPATMLSKDMYVKRLRREERHFQQTMTAAPACQTRTAWNEYTWHMDSVHLLKYWYSMQEGDVNAKLREKFHTIMDPLSLYDYLQLRGRVLERVAHLFKELREKAFVSGTVRPMKAEYMTAEGTYANDEDQIYTMILSEVLTHLMEGEHPLIKFGAGDDRTRIMPMPFYNSKALTEEDRKLRRAIMRYFMATECLRQKPLAIKQGLESYEEDSKINLYKAESVPGPDGEAKLVYEKLSVANEVRENLVTFGRAKKILDKHATEYGITEGFKLVTEQILHYAICFRPVYKEEVKSFVAQTMLASNQTKTKNAAEREEQAYAKAKLQQFGGGHFFNVHYQQLFNGSGEKLSAGVLTDVLTVMGELMNAGESFGPAYVERRLRLAYNGLRILNAQSNKRIRACLECRTVVCNDQHFAEILKGVYDTIGESHDKDNSSWKQQYINGRRIVQEQIAKIKKSGKTIDEWEFKDVNYENIFLIRFAFEIMAAKEYARNRQAEYRAKGKECRNKYAGFIWTVPCEIDQTASCAQYYGALLGDPMLLWLTGVINTRHTADIKRDFYAAYVNGDKNGELIDRNSCKPLYLQIMYSKEFMRYETRDGRDIVPLEDLVDHPYYRRKYFPKGLKAYGRDGLIEKLEHVRHYNMARLRTVQVFIDWIKKYGLEQIAGDIRFSDNDIIRYVNTKFVTYTEDEFAGQAVKRYRKTVGFKFSYPQGIFKVRPCTTFINDIYEINPKRAINYYATALIHHQDALTAAWVCKVLIKKGKFCFPIHDAFVVSPEDRQLVKRMVATRLRWLYKHRHEIMRTFLNSVAPAIQYDVFELMLEAMNKLQREDLAKELTELNTPQTDVTALLNLHSSVWVKYNRGMK